MIDISVTIVVTLVLLSILVRFGYITLLRTFFYTRYETMLLLYLEEVYQRIYKEDLVVYVTSGFTLSEDEIEFSNIIKKFISLMKIRLGTYRYKFLLSILFKGKEDEFYDYIVYYLQDKIYQDVVEQVIRTEATQEIKGG